MREIIMVEKKRILSNKSFIIISLAILTFSIFSSITSLKKYNVYDQSGNIIISSKDNLKESKLDKHNKLLNEKTIREVVDRKDKSKFLYNSNLVTLVASNYEKKIEDLTDKDIDDFYNQRMVNVGVNLGGTAMIEDIEKVVSNSKELRKPIEIGYAEGWKNLNNDMIDFTTIIIFIVPFIILSIFGEDPKIRMKQLYTATKYGKKDLVKAKVITGFGVGTIIYITAIGIFSISKLMILGFKGVNLPIQSSVKYLFCPYNLTYFQQYLINVFVGFMAMLFLVSITLLVTSILEQILSSAVVVAFILVIMPMLPNNNFEFNHYFKNFLPYSMTNFNSYYIHPEIYTIFGEIIPMYILVILMAFIVCFISTLFILFVSNKKLSRGLK
ncbi:MAG: hypothetical protein RR835_10800 [Peptostreptococcaceae bacterium]